VQSARSDGPSAGATACSRRRCTHKPSVRVGSESKLTDAATPYTCSTCRLKGGLGTAGRLG